MAAGFRNEELSDGVAVRAVTSDSAHIWLRTSRPGQHRIAWWPAEKDGDAGEISFEIPAENDADNTQGIRLPSEGDAFKPMTLYKYRVTTGDHVVGEGRFRTFPEGPADSPKTLSFAILSCNQPFDSEGNVRPDTRQMLRAIYRVLERHNCAFIVNMGDLTYSDMPLSLSLFDPEYFERIAPPGRGELRDCTTAEVRRLYNARQRRFWSLPELRAIAADFPNFNILDDHDIVDNWGSDPAHRRSEWRSVGEGARWSYHDYHATYASHRPEKLPESFHYDFSYGHSSFFVMDIRSERWVDVDEGRLFSPSQEQDFVSFLERTRDQKSVFVVLSVPPVHLPRFLAHMVARLSRNGEDFSDRWSSLGHIDDRNRFMRRLREHQRKHPEQRFVLLAGDIHVGCAHEIRWSDDGASVYQLISSGFTNRVGRLVQAGARWLMHLNSGLNPGDDAPTADVHRIRGVEGRKENPYAALNVGIVQVSVDDPDKPASLEYFLYGHDGDEPVCVYQTPPL